MDVLSNAFERRWFALFMFLYVLIMLPLPCFYSSSYIAGFFGVPLFIYGWLFHGCLTLICIIIFAHKALQRPEYRDLE